MPDTGFDELVRLITGNETPRVWSLLVTLFGDIVQPSDGQISGAALNRIIGLAGVKPEAIRVALYRLRKDRWIDSVKSGRESRYFLTDRGAAQTAEAAPRIYANGPLASTVWLIATDPKQIDPLPLTEAHWVTPGLALVSCLPDDRSMIFSTQIAQAERLPDWMRRSICEAPLIEQCKGLDDRLSEVNEMLDAAQLSLVEMTTLRVLIVHAWRRVVLRMATLPDFVFPTDWRGADVRAKVAVLLKALPRQSIADLEELS